MKKMYPPIIRLKVFILCVCLLGVIVFAVGPAAAESHFPSKAITFVVPVSPGGGFDTATRMIVPYLKKYLPGQPNVIVKNAPGGEWNIGIGKIYRAKPDGHTIGILNLPGNAVNQVLGTAKFDLRKITLMTPSTFICHQVYISI